MSVNNLQPTSTAIATGCRADAYFNDVLSEFGNRLLFCLALTLPIAAYSEGVQHGFGYHLDLAGRPYLLLVWCSIIYAYGGWLFGLGLLTELRQRRLGRQTLYTLASTGGYLASLVMFANRLPETDCFLIVSLLIDGLLLSSYLEMKWRGQRSDMVQLFMTIWSPAEDDRYRLSL